MLVKNFRLGTKLFYSYLIEHRFYFVFGIVLGILLYLFWPFFFTFVSKSKVNKIGVEGNYGLSNLPSIVQSKLSFGLTRITDTGLATSAAASEWVVSNDGKKVKFKLRDDLIWQDGKGFNSNDVNYNLKGVSLLKEDGNHISFEFSEPFSPLLSVVSQPLFRSGLLGLGEYKAESISFSGRFISSLAMRNVKNHEQLIYKFFPTNERLLLALKLGIIDEAVGLREVGNLNNDKRYDIKTTTQSATLVTLFFNTSKEPFESKTVRQALAYGIAELSFVGEQAFTASPRGAWFESSTVKKYGFRPDITEATISKLSSSSSKLKFKLASELSLKELAKQIADSWIKVGMQVEVVTVDSPPNDFDIYLGFLEVGNDPDQYAIWHSTQTGNISKIKSPKIDRLLEEGRRTIDPVVRKKIYLDFQKALSEEVPAIFLYYPVVYDVKRR